MITTQADTGTAIVIVIEIEAGIAETEIGIESEGTIEGMIGTETENKAAIASKTDMTTKPFLQHKTRKCL